MMLIVKLKKIILNFPGVKRIHYHYARNKNVLGEVPFQKNHVNLNCADWSWQPNVGDYLPRVVFEYMINRGGIDKVEKIVSVIYDWKHYKLYG